jgi:hypothetical protein
MIRICAGPGCSRRIYTPNQRRCWEHGSLSGPTKTYQKRGHPPPIRAYNPTHNVRKFVSPKPVVIFRDADGKPRLMGASLKELRTRQYGEVKKTDLTNL